MNRLLAMLLTVTTLFGSGATHPAAYAAEDASVVSESSSTQRMNISFNNDWRFFRGNATGAERVDFDDSSWLFVNTPHSTIQYTPENYYQADLGVFWYRRTFDTPVAALNKQILLTFEGAMQDASVWLNDEKLGSHKGGYTEFAFDLTGKLKNDGSQNVLAVKLDTRPNSGFAPGKNNPDFQYFGGIYRNVYLTVTDPVHITDAIYANTVAGGGVFLTAPEVSTEQAVVKAKTQVKNSSEADASVSVLTELIYKGASVASAESDAQQIVAGAAANFTQALTVSNPKLWSLETPELYTVRTTVKKDGTSCDSMYTVYGIRKVEWKRDGLYLNDKFVELVGTNLHSETYMLGNAQSDDAIFAEMKRVRENGFNFVRMSHYPHSPAFYEAADQYGIAVLDCLAGWQFYNNTTEFNNSCYDQIRDMLRENRNHPSVVAWEPSLNESNFTTAWAREAHRITKEEYPDDGISKAYTSGWKDFSVFDIIAATPQANVVKAATDFPQKPVIVAEYGDWNYGGFSSSSRVTREPAHLTNAQGQAVQGGDAGMLAQCDNIQESLAFNRKQEWGKASAYWQYADYAGFDTAVLTYCGVVDVARIPKFGMYFYQSQRDPELDLSAYGIDSGPMAFIANTWATNSPSQVRVFSNCDTVKLYLDDELIAEQTPDTTMWGPHGSLNNNPTNFPANGQTISTENLAHPPFTFDVSGKGTPGTGVLRVEGYIGGEKKAEFTRRAPGSAAQVTLTPENDQPLKLDGSTAKLVWVDVKDENGTVVNTANTDISFATEGPGFVVGEKTMPVRGGQWAVWVRSTRGSSDTITLTATVDGLTAAVLSIPTQAVAGIPAAPEGGDADETDFVQPAPMRNLALNKRATASTEETHGGKTNTADKANDGKTNTKWCEQGFTSSPWASLTVGTADIPGVPQWWEVDLGESCSVSAVTLGMESPTGAQYEYYVSLSDRPDAWSESDIVCEKRTGAGGEITLPVNQAGRYLRVTFTRAAGGAWANLMDIQVLGTTRNIALGKTAAAQSTSSGGSAALAVDGDTSTFWSAGAQGPKWWQVDLGAYFHVTDVSLDFAWAIATDPAGVAVRHSFTLQGSRDGKNWIDVESWSDMDQGENNPTVQASVKMDNIVRYLRVKDLEAKLRGTTNQWVEIAEVAVNGEPMGKETRLDYGAPATATSSAAGSAPAHGNDGDPAKYWIPDAEDSNPSWQFAAAGIYTFKQIDLSWNGSGTHQYKIDISTDGENWTSAVDQMSIGVSGSTTTDHIIGSGRFVRISLQQGTTDGFWINSTGWVKAPALEVDTVAALATVSATIGTAFDQLALPKEVRATSTTGVDLSIPVTWASDGYSSTSDTAQTLTGVLSAMDGVANSAGHTAQIIVALSPDTGKDNANVSFATTIPSQKIYGDAPFTVSASVANAGTGTGTWAWISSDPTVLAISGTDSSATVTVLKSGSATLTAKYSSDTTMGEAVTAPIAVDKATLVVQPKSFSIYIGDTMPTAAVSYIGLKFNDIGAEVATLASGSLTMRVNNADNTGALGNTATSGTYKIIFADMPVFRNSDKYDITTGEGSLTISTRSSSSGGSSSSARPIVSTSGSGGTASASANGTVFITPDAGYQIAKITVNGKEVPIPTNGKLTGLKSTDKVIVTFEKVKEPTKPGAVDFTDMQNHWAKDAVQFVTENGIMNGTGTNTFGPNAPMTRAMVWTVLARVKGIDTARGANWYETAQKWSMENGISDGTMPESNITREQLATLLYRYSGSPKAIGAEMSEYKDSTSVSVYAKDAMLWAVQQGLISGHSDGTLNPAGNATRAEVATILMRLLNK